MAEKGTDTPPAVTAQGSSVSWTARKKGVLNIWEAFWQYYCEKEKVKGPNSTGGSASSSSAGAEGGEDDDGYAAPNATSSWDELSEKTLCSEQIYEEYATWLTYHYKCPVGSKSANKFLAMRPLVNTFCTTINLAKSKFGATASNMAKLFFTCLDPNATTAAARWLRGMKANMRRCVSARTL